MNIDVVACALPGVDIKRSRVPGSDYSTVEVMEIRRIAACCHMTHFLLFLYWLAWSEKVHKMRRDRIAGHGLDDGREIGAVVILGDDGVAAHLYGSGPCCQVDLDLVAVVPIVTRRDLAQACKFGNLPRGLRRAYRWLDQLRRGVFGEKALIGAITQD